MQLINLNTVCEEFSTLDFGQIIDVLNNNKITSVVSPLLAKWAEVLEQEEGDIIPLIEDYNDLSFGGGEFNLVDIYKHVSDSNSAFEQFLSLIGLYIEMTEDLEEDTTLISQDDFTEFMKREAVESGLVHSSMVNHMNWEEYAETARIDYKTFELRSLDYNVYASEPSNIEHYFPIGSYYYRA